MKLGGNPFWTILHISFFEADFFGVAVPRPDLITITPSSLPDLSFGDDARQLAPSSLTLSSSMEIVSWRWRGAGGAVANAK